MRLEHWEKDLSDYLAEAEHREFSYGAYDCCLFIADVVKILRGFDPAEGLRVYDTKEDAHAVIARYGSLEKMIETIAAKSGFKEIDKVFAQRGDAVFARLSGGSVGVCIGSQVAFPRLGKGLVKYPLSSAAMLRAWRVE